MKRLLKSWVFWAFVVPPIVGALLFGIHREDAWSSCLCGSMRTRSGWYVGWPDSSWRLGHPSTTVTPSALSEELLRGTHVHAWNASGISFNSALSSRIACGGYGPVTGFAVLYQSHAGFRGWLRSEVAAGRVDRTVLEVRVMNPATPLEFAFGWTPPP